MAAQHLDNLQSTREFFKNEDPQSESPLFKLPGELRDSIYDAALSTFEDKNKLYYVNTYWARPRYSAPRKSDLTLLRTCKRIYHEAWFKPWSLADHSFWLTSKERSPVNAISCDRFGRVLRQVHEHQGNVEIDHVRFFAQMWVLEQKLELNRFLKLHYFYPVTVTITIRHTDWWFWEDDEWLRISSKVSTFSKFPTSTRKIHMELETLERKKEQVDSIAKQMKEKWHFTKTDGSMLSARHTAVDVERWRGSSTWASKRWIRDETDPDYVDYYVATVTWEHEPDFDKENARMPPDLLTTHRPTKMGQHGATIEWRSLVEAEVPLHTKAEDALAMIREAEERREKADRKKNRRRSLRGSVSGGRIQFFRPS